MYNKVMNYSAYARRSGFTIVELLVVVVVIAILAAVIAVAYNGVTSQAHEAMADSKLSDLRKQAELLKVEDGSDRYPSVLPGLARSQENVYTSYYDMGDGTNYCVGVRVGGITKHVMSSNGSVKDGVCLSACSGVPHIACSPYSIVSAVAQDSRGDYYALHYSAYSYYQDGGGMHRVKYHAGFSKYDKNLKALWTRVASGSSDGEIDATYNPWGIYVDPQDNVWVADSGNHRYQKFDKNGNFLLKIGGTASGAAPEQFNTPYGLAFTNDGHVWTSDRYNHRLKKYTLQGQLVQTVTTSPGAVLSQPHALYIDAAQNIFVASRTSHTIQKFNAAGQFIATIGAGVAGSGDGQLREPTNVLVDPGNGDIYTYEIQNRRISVFNASGAFLRNFSVASNPSMPNHRSFNMIWQGDDIMLSVQSAGNVVLQLVSKSGETKKVIERKELLLGL